VPLFKRKHAVEPPAGTPQFIGKAKEPLAADVVEALRTACADDPRVAAAYLYWSMLALPGEVPHHTVGLVLTHVIDEPELRQITDGIYSKAADSLDGETLDFQFLTDDSRRKAEAAVPPIFEREAESN
jgi:SseB protein C-terminal domain